MTVSFASSLLADAFVHMFIRPNVPGNPLRSAANVAGHFSLLVLVAAAVFFATVQSLLGNNGLIASGPALIGAWALIGFVAAGIFTSSYRFAVYGLSYLAGLIGAMALGAQTSDPLAMGWTYQTVCAALLVAAVARWYTAPAVGRYAAS